MSYLYLHPHFVSEKQALFKADNRAFRYGDALFESLVQFNKHIPFLADHFERLTSGMKVFQMELPNYLTLSFLQNTIAQLTHHNQHNNARIRVCVYRADGGLYLPTHNNVELLITTQNIEQNHFELPSKGVRLGCYSDVPLSYHVFSSLKTANSLPYILAALYAAKNNFDDCLLLNTQGNVADSISSNIFLLKKQKLYTPPITEGGIDGIMRKKITDFFWNFGKNLLPLTPIEQTINLQDLQNADEIWLTNAVRGIRWVQNFGNHHYSNSVALQTVKLLNKYYLLSNY